MDYLDQLGLDVKIGKISTELRETLEQVYSSYTQAAFSNGHSKELSQSILKKFLTLVENQLVKPFSFEPYHQRISEPFDYYEFGLQFIRPLVILQRSMVINPEIASQVTQQISNRDNAVLFANHQVELDPQAISLLLEKNYPVLAKEMIFIAGHRVITDPLAVPFSMGRNLLCIFSKKYIDGDPALKEQRQRANQRTMNKMSQLLSEGGKCIYVAPSGGRDRPGRYGQVEVSPFDPKSIEMFYLMAKQADRPTHFYPLALSTYDLLPPPDQIKNKIGEPRVTKATPIHLAFGPEIDMEACCGEATMDRSQRRRIRAQYIWEQVSNLYRQMVEGQ